MWHNKRSSSHAPKEILIDPTEIRFFRLTIAISIGFALAGFSGEPRMTGPGPNKYFLPSLTGFDKHDPRKTRYPAYSVGFRVYPEKENSGNPGPKYDPGQNIRTGNYTGPNAVVLPRRDHELNYNGIPGPVKYNPGPDPALPTPPSAVVLARKEPPRQLGTTPGPKYLVKGTIGRAIEELPSAPAWSILGRNIQLDINRNSPGPRYAAVEPKLTKTRYPEATITSRHEPPGQGIVPGPKYLGPYRALKSQEPSWSFGVKHSEKKASVMTQEDRKPFYGF